GTIAARCTPAPISATRSGACCAGMWWKATGSAERRGANSYSAAVRGRQEAIAAARRRALSADHGHTLDLDQHPGAGKMRHRDQRRSREVAVGEEALAQFHEPVAIARIVDEHRHS